MAKKTATPKAPKPTPAPKPKPAAKPKAKPKGKEKAPAEVDYKSPEYLAAYDSETVREGNAQVSEIYELKSEWDILHEQAAAKKKAYEQARTAHFTYVRERMDMRGKKPNHLFAEAEARETMEKAAPAAKGKKKGSGASKELPTAPEAKGSGWFPDDLWKQFPIERLTDYGLKPGDVAALKDATNKKGGEAIPLVLMGDLTLFSTPMENGYTRRLTDIKGIGPAAVERIETANGEFFARWPQLAEAFAVEKGYRRPDPLADQGATSNADEPGATASVPESRTEPADDGETAPRTRRARPTPSANGTHVDAHADAEEPAAA